VSRYLRRAALAAGQYLGARHELIDTIDRGRLGDLSARNLAKRPPLRRVHFMMRPRR
jgi:hypothetical protein